MLELLLLGALIQSNATGIFAYDDTGMIYNGTDSFEAWNAAIQHNNEIKFTGGNFNFHNHVLTVPPGVSIEGSSIMVDPIANTISSSLTFENGGMLKITSFNVIDKVRVFCKLKTEVTPCFVVAGHDNDIRNVFVMGNKEGIGVLFTSALGGPNFENHVMKLGISNSAYALRLENATQNVFSQVTIAAYNRVGAWLINSDHNHFDHIHFAAPANNKVTDLKFGTKKGDQTLGNTIDDLTLRTGNINIISNTYILNRPNVIQFVGIDGPLQMYFQEGGKPESIIIHDISYH